MAAKQRLIPLLLVACRLKQHALLLHVSVAMFLVLWPGVCQAEVPPSPYGAVEAASKLNREMSLDELRYVIRNKQLDLGSGMASDSHKNRAFAALFLAELMKSTGYHHDEAEVWYKRAIASDADPAYELFYAEYLRVYRGANRPLFLRAEEHYYRAAEKLRHRQDAQEWDLETGRRIRRSLIALYERDGISPVRLLVGNSPSPGFESKPIAFFSSQNLFAVATTDLPAITDTRDFTSEVMFASSQTRLNRPLSANELTALVRPKPQADTLQRLRLRPPSFPVVDLFLHQDGLHDAQITQFFRPDDFNDVRISDGGIALSMPWESSTPAFDGWSSVAYRELDRQGTIEFNPNGIDHIRQVESTLAVARFIGPDKILWESTGVYQDIRPNVQGSPNRSRIIGATQLKYFLYRRINTGQNVSRSSYDYRFDPRGVELFGGVFYDDEQFPPVHTYRSDYYLGAAIRGVQLSDRESRWIRNWDFVFQETLFDSTVSNDSSLTNKQLRTGILALGRLKDEEVPPQNDEDVGRLYPAFIHIAFPWRLDVATDGIRELENWSTGIQCHSKWYDTDFGGAVFLLSLGYTHQHFYRIGKGLDLATISINLGF